MRYGEDDLKRLRARWHEPLRPPDRELGDGEDGEPEGCRTFHELLHLRLREVDHQGTRALSAAGECNEPESWRGVLRAGWERQGDLVLSGLLLELKELGLDGVAPIEEPRYLIREPADLRGAELSGLRLCGAYLENAHFEGADLAGVRFDGARCFETHFEDARCEHASFVGAECHFASFQGADCDRALFQKSDCTTVDFRQAHLRQVNFDAAVCYAADFDGAYLAKAQLAAMHLNHFSRFGAPGELAEARLSRPGHKKAREEGDDWFIVELFPAWLRAAEVCAQIRFLLKAHGYFLEADEYQYLEMVCRRHLLHRNPLSHFLEWFLKDLMFGYGLKWKRPLISVLGIVLLWATGFGFHFYTSTPNGVFASFGYGLYYSIISFTTLGFGNAPDLDGLWPRFLLCSEALLGTILMPLFLLAYARKILQD